MTAARKQALSTAEGEGASPSATAAPPKESPGPWP